MKTCQENAAGYSRRPSQTDSNAKLHSVLSQLISDALPKAYKGRDAEAVAPSTSANLAARAAVVRV